MSSPAAPAGRRLRLVVGEAQQGPLISSVVFATAVCLLGLTVFTNEKLQVVAPILAAVVVFAMTYERLLRWRSQVAVLIAVILFIPMGRYTLPASLPFNLEPYRVLVACVAVAWGTSLLIDPRVRFRRTPVDGPLIACALAVIFSEIVNHVRVAAIQSFVIKQLLFLLSYLVVVYLIVSVVRRFEDVDFLARVLTGGGAVVAFFAIIEARTGYDIFNHLQTAIPFLHLDVANLPVIPSRGGRLRVFASAQHPIALGSAMAMLIPFAVYRAHCYRERIWWGAALLLALRRFRHRISDGRHRHDRDGHGLRLAAARAGPALLAGADPGAARDPLRRPREPRGDEGGVLTEGRARRAADKRERRQRPPRDALAGAPP